MPQPSYLPPRASENDETVAAALRQQDQADYALARSLYLCWINGYYRLHGFRSVGAYLRDRFKGTDVDQVAQASAKTVQRLIREYKLAMEIPAFGLVFDQLSRSSRRLLAQVLTVDNAAHWIERATVVPASELEREIRASKDPSTVENRPVWVRFKLYPAQKELLDRALALVSEMFVRESGEDAGPVTAQLDVLAQEFIATYGGRGQARSTVLSFCPACSGSEEQKDKPGQVMMRVPEEDQCQDGRMLLVFRCLACQVSSVFCALEAVS